MFKIGHRNENYFNEADAVNSYNSISSNNGSYDGPEVGSRYSYNQNNNGSPAYSTYKTVQNASNLKLPINMNKKGKTGPQQVYATNKRGYGNAHLYNINSISIHSDGETFLSADDLRINTWNAERNSCCYSKYLYIYIYVYN